MCYFYGMPSKFATVMIVYVLLALVGILVLDGQFRLATLILLGGLAVKTLIARGAGW
jgi:hypothetical protein